MQPYQKDKLFFACGESVYIEKDDHGETHIYSATDGKKLTNADISYGEVYAGGENLNLKSAKVTMRSGIVKILSGGSIGGTTEKTEVILEGGMIGDCLYGAGISDTVSEAKITVTGGAIKHGVFLGGKSKACHKANISFNNASATYLFTGSASPDTVCGETEVKILGGNILSLILGGENSVHGKISVTVSSGLIEKEISRKNYEGAVKLRLYQNLFTFNGLDLTFPSLPQNTDIEYLPDAEKPKIPVAESTNHNLFDIADNKLTFLFFELRHPKIPRSASPFPYFIGSCVYIKFPNGENMLLDTGNDYNEKEIFDNLKRLNVKKLNYLVITHYHGDHIGTADKIIEKYEIDKVILPDIKKIPNEKDIEYYNRLFTALKSKNCPTEYISRGNKLNIGDEVSILCLNPIKNSNAQMNDCSVALKFTYKENSVILGGDMGEAVEKELTEIYGKKLKCDLLKLSHHGITDQTYYKYVDFCSPKAVVIDTLRPDGCFVKTTEYSLTHINKIPQSDIYITGNNGLIKAEFSGEKEKIKIEYQYKI